MKVNVQLLPRTSQERTKLALKFSMRSSLQAEVVEASADCVAEDGKQMDLDLDKLRIKEVTEEVNRHSRMLGRQEELTGG